MFLHTINTIYILKPRYSMQELDRSTDSVMTGYGSGHMRQAISVGGVALIRTIIKLTSIEME